MLRAGIQHIATNKPLTRLDFSPCRKPRVSRRKARKYNSLAAFMPLTCPLRGGRKRVHARRFPKRESNQWSICNA
jgi:hypothetical protein